MPDTGIAQITRLGPNDKPTGDSLLVQFNPQKLHLSYSTSNAPNDGPGHQNVQNAGTGSATLSLDLEFDTADEGTTTSPVSVRSKTNPFEQLILPDSGNAQDKSKPPKIKFSWGDLVIVGFMEGLNVDFDLFASNGYPLHAKLSFTIKSQDARQELSKVGPGSNTAPPTPGSPGLGAVGGIGLGLSASLGASAGLGLSAGVGLGASLSAGVSIGGQTAVAIGGESAAEFAARVGVDPQAWRAIAAGQVDGTLSIQAGAELSFDASFSAAAGMGATSGVEAQLGGSVGAAFGLSTSPPSPTAGQAGPGFALAAAGGLAAALQTVEIVGATSAAASTRRAFDAPMAPQPPSPATGAPAGVRPPASQGLSGIPPATIQAALSSMPAASPARPDAPPQSRSPLAVTGMPSPSAQASALPAPPPPRADPRASTFGLGVPLRPRIGGAADQRAGSMGGAIPLRPRARAGAAPISIDPTAAPWVALPQSSASPPSAPGTASSGCGCGGGCASCGGRQ
jgi:hypothetical protein